MDEGDSASGSYFLDSNLYYLTEIMSVKDPELKNLIAVSPEVKNLPHSMDSLDHYN